MSINACDRILNCPCPPSPFSNLSAELPDPPSFFSFQFFDAQVPLGAPDPWFGTTVGVDGCTSVISQTDANDCALRNAEGDVWNTWPANGRSGPAIQVFGNHAVQCQLDCGTGFVPFIYTVPAGTVIARTQEEADAIAASYCFNRARQVKVCKPVPPAIKPPLEWWTFEEPSTVLLTGAVHGTLMDWSGTAVSTGKVGTKGQRLISGSSYTVHPFPNAINSVTSTTFDVTFWHRWNDYNVAEGANFNITTAELFDNTGTSLGRVELHWFSLTQRLQIRIFDQFGFAQVSQNFLPAFIPVIGTWYHVKLSYDGVSGKASVNVYNQATFTTTLGFALIGIPTSAVINGVLNGGGPTFAGNSSTDEMAFWNYTLSAADEAILFNNGAGRTWPFS